MTTTTTISQRAAPAPGKRKSKPDAVAYVPPAAQIAEAKRVHDHIARQLLAAHPELADDPEALRDTAMGEADVSIEDVQARLLLLAKRVEKEADAADSVADEINARAGRKRAFAKSVKAAVTASMSETGGKIKRPELTAYIQQGRERVEIIDPAAIPPEYVDFDPSIRLADVKAALVEGIEVPGAKLVRGDDYVVVRI